jgi:lipoprotein signal peptidase
MADVIGLWISAILTIMITTLAWKDTPVSKTAEHIYLGVITANSIVMAWGNIDSVGIQKIMSGQILYIIPVILGIMAYARYSKENFWIYRYPIALVVGIGVGTAMSGLVGGSVLDNIKASFYQLNVPGDIGASLNNLIMVVTLVSAMMYFIFTIKATRNPLATKLSTFGRYAMMAAFGYSFANTIATRINQYAGRIAFLMLEWLQLG